MRTELLESLRFHGAPLAGVRAVGHFPLEETVLSGVRGSKESAALLRLMPVMLLRNVDRLHLDKLHDLAVQAGLTSEVGMVLELAGEMGSSEALVTAARKLEAARSAPTLRPWLERTTTAGLELAHLRTPAVVRRWGFLLNMPEETFVSAIKKALM